MSTVRNYEITYVCDVCGKSSSESSATSLPPVPDGWFTHFHLTQFSPARAARTTDVPGDHFCSTDCAAKAVKAALDAPPSPPPDPAAP